jgi:hypothetical protein
MPPHLFALCQTNDAYREEWERRAKDMDEPSLLDKTVNFAKAVAQQDVAGFPSVPEKVFLARLAVCETCDRREPSNETCKECGCYLRVKAWWATQDCPLGRWPKYPENAPEGAPSPCGGCKGG